MEQPKSRSSATSFVQAARERFSRDWLRTTVGHNRPHRDELRQPIELLRGSMLHLKLRHDGFTMLSSRHARTLHALAARIEAEQIPGVIVDCGVWNGGSSAILANAAPSRTVYALDSFEGLPEPSGADGADSAGWAGRYRGSAERVTEAFARFANPRQLRVLPGWFDQTLPTVVHEIDQVALLHVDADWYESVREALEALADKLAPGAFVAIDDYSSWVGARKAADEFRRAKGMGGQLVAEHYWRVDR